MPRKYAQLVIIPNVITAQSAFFSVLRHACSRLLHGVAATNKHSYHTNSPAPLLNSDAIKHPFLWLPIPLPTSPSANVNHEPLLPQNAPRTGGAAPKSQRWLICATPASSLPYLAIHPYHTYILRNTRIRFPLVPVHHCIGARPSPLLSPRSPTHATPSGNLHPHNMSCS